MILGAIPPLGGHTSPVVLKIDENRIKQVRQLVGQEGLAHTTLAGVAHSNVDRHTIIIAL